MLLISSAFLLGFVHGLGADHLMAIAALAARGGDAAAARTRAVPVAVRFATGHALLLGLGAAAAIVVGWSIPVAVERGGEIAGGCLLVGLGAAGLWALATGRVYGHVHPPTGWHLHLSRRDRHPLRSMHNASIPTIVGAVFAISSLRALVMLAPVGGAATSLPIVLLLVALFGFGILLSMSLFGVALARAMSTRAVARLGRAAGVIMAIGSIALGVYWISSSAPAP